MSIWSKFRSKKFLTVFVIAVTLTLCAVVAISVMVPTWVCPLTMTEAPMTGIPSSSATTPETVIS